MAVTYALIGSEDEVRAGLDQLCDLFGLVSLGAFQLPGQAKWLGRAAVPTEPRVEVRRLPATGS